jgi:hypothetical protein
VRYACDRPANDQPDRLISKDAGDDVRGGERSAFDRELEARVHAGQNEESRPADDGDRDRDPPPSPEQQPEEQ